MTARSHGRREGEMQMKRIATVKPGVILLTVLTASIPGFAANTGSTSLHLSTSTKVGSNNLPAGDYKITWTDSDASSSDTEVSFVQGRKVVATAPAKLVHVKNDTTSLQTNTEPDGIAVLEEIHLAHVNLSFDRPTTAQR
jgi:hypothetical protein